MKFEIRYQVCGREVCSNSSETEDYVLITEQKSSRMRAVIRAKKELCLDACFLEEPYAYPANCRIFLNGYQSWTDSGEFELSEQMHNMNRVPHFLKDRFHFEAYGDAWFLEYQKDRFHSFTFTYIRDADDHAELIGSFNEANAFLIIYHQIKQGSLLLSSDCRYKCLQPGEEFCLFDLVRLSGNLQEVSDFYFSTLGSCDAPPVRGYTSWYLHYQDISEGKIEAALEGISKEEFDLFQIDDGFETFVGDWLEIDPVKFPNGLQTVVEKIHAKGLKAGIWLAPFVCETKSRLYQKHPDWIYRENGREVFAGSNWSGDVVLDIRKPEVQDYIKQFLQYYCSLGFDFFKLDFLYAAALIHENAGYTRAQIMRMAMEGLRGLLNDKLILGCGVPLSSAFGLVDYCRIGPDVSLKFDDVFYMRPMHRERISTKNTIPNTIFRSCMDGYVFRCDPDVFLLRDDHIGLSAAQREALLMLNHLCGSVYMTSDQVGEYDDEKKALLKKARKLAEAEICGIQKEGDLIKIRYLLDGRDDTLVYNRKNGILV